MADLPRQLQRQAAEVTAIEKAMADEITPPQEQPEAPADPAPAPAPPAPPPPDVWQQRYQTLDGKYKAEVPRLYAEIKTLKEQIAELNRPPAAPAPTPPAPSKREKQKLVTSKDAENFGEDLLDLIKRQAQEIASEREDALQAEIEKLRAENAALQDSVKGVTQSQAASSEEVYLTKLTTLVPDWETINTNPGFLAWLGETDPLSGLPRQAYLDNAYQARDVKRTAVLFNAWRATQTPPASTPPAPTRRPDVERQVTPGKSKVASPAADADDNTRIWSNDEIAAVYTGIRAGTIKAAEAAKLEAQIDLAVSQGRVR